MISSRNIKRYLIGIVVLSAIVYSLIFFYKAIKNDPNDPIMISSATPQTFVDLFNETSKHKLVFNKTLCFRDRDTILLCTYDKIYKILLTKIDIANRFNLSNDLIEVYSKANGRFDYNIPYKSGPITSHYRDNLPKDVASKIYLTSPEFSVQSKIKNDTTAYYSLKASKIYVQYKIGGVFEFFTDINAIELPKKADFVNLIFYKKNKSLYFFILYTDDQNAPNKDFLTELIRR